MQRLEPELAVGGLPAPLAVLAAALVLQLQSGRGPELVDVAAGETGAVGAVPVLLEQHGTPAPRAATRRSRLHRPPPPFRVQQKSPSPVALVWPFQPPPGLVDGFGSKG